MGVFTNSGAVTFKAGLARSSSLTEANWNQAISDAENYILGISRVDYSGAYSTLTAPHKFLLNEAAASFAAINIIGFDMSGYTNLNHAEDLININFDRGTRALDQLKDSKWKQSIGVTE